MAAMMTFDFQTFFIFSLFCLFSVLCYSLFFKKPKFGCDDLPPSPPSLPVIGHLHLILSSLAHKSFQKLSSKYGDFLHLRIFNVRIVLVSSASVAHEIFKVQDVNVSSRGHVAVDESLLLGSYSFLMAPYGDYWKFMKKLTVTKLLGPQALERSRGVRANELEKLYANLLDKAMNKESVDIGAEVMKLTHNSICKMMFGKSISEENGEADKMRSLITEGFGMTTKAFLSAVLRRPLEKFGISLFKKEIMSVSNRCEELMERVLVERETKLEEHHQGGDIINMLLTAYRDKNAEYNINRNHIKSVTMDLIGGGTDTLVHAIQWIMAELINNPKVLERLREEIDYVVGNTRLIQEADIPNLPYLQAVVKEGLRLHPSFPVVFRLFRRGCKVRGFNIPKSTLLVLNTYVVMRDPNVWEDPEEFNPERFLGGSSRSGQVEDEVRELKYLPFGGGRRACPGSNLAYIVLGTAIGMMVQCFDWRIDGDKVNMEEARGALTLSMAHPLKCTPIPRNPEPVLSFNLIVREEQRLTSARVREQQQETLGFTTRREELPVSVRPSQTDSRSESSSSSIRRDRNTLCSHCGRSGHEKKECWQLIGFPEWWTVDGQEQKSEWWTWKRWRSWWLQPCSWSWASQCSSCLKFQCMLTEVFYFVIWMMNTFSH
ncbi:unnamed protein product [Microthlaspi erraticum]|uniref:CCHC-type domain-containing protein n=1 Tax=Microthlaspi erraticum TaxID=1685480 RepID=A0A6D2IN99_9BRAS|nr:unnamed protein product [Microthlaspi erraticum]